MPAKRRYQIVAVERDGTPIAELVDAQIDNVKWTLTPPGSATINMQQTDPLVGVPLLSINEVQVFIEDMLDPWWGIWRKCANTASQAAFECETLEGYFKSSFIDHASLDFDTAIEQFDIAWGLVNYAQTNSDGSPNARRNRHILRDNTVTPSGVTRVREYDRNNHGNILDLLGEFPTLVNLADGTPSGFDWEVKARGDGTRLWTPYYPQRGVLHADIALEWGRNISDMTISEDATSIATTAWATGGNDGTIKIENVYDDTAAGDIYGEMTSIKSFGDTQDVTELLTYARSFVELHNHPDVEPTLTGIEVPDTLFGVIWPGDSIPVSIHRGRVNIEGTYRVAAVTWKPGPSKLTLDFVPVVST